MGLMVAVNKHSKFYRVIAENRAEPVAQGKC